MATGRKGKLTPDQVKYFRQNMHKKRLVDFAKELPVSASQLCRIRSGMHWKEIGNEQGN